MRRIWKKSIILEMEKLVNYSSEDEQDEPGYKRPAERGGMNRGGSGYGKNAGSRTSCRDEATESRHKSYTSGSRSSSSSFQRDNKERYASTRDSKETRDYSNGHQRYDSKSGHDRNYQRHARDFKNDEPNKRERSRIDERYSNNRYSIGNSSYNQNSRDNRPRSSGGSNFDNSRSRHYRSTRGNDDEREERSERFSTSRPERHRHQYNNNTKKDEHKHSSRNRRSHSRSRSRSKSRSRSLSRPKERRSSPIGERAERSNPLNYYEADSSSVREKKSERSQQHSHTTMEPAEQSSTRHIAPLMSLPLSESVPKHPSLVAVTNVVAATASSGFESNEPAVIQLPNYYNPSVINPTKYADQVQKRKLLWSAKKNEDTTAKWGNAQFSQDTDGKVATKFMRLMGIKNASGGKSEVEEKPVPTKDVRSREAMFTTMEHQYEVARQATHTMRGVGLGFGSSRPF